MESPFLVFTETYPSRFHTASYVTACRILVRRPYHVPHSRLSSLIISMPIRISNCMLTADAAPSICILIPTDGTPFTWPVSSNALQNRIKHIRRSYTSMSCTQACWHQKTQHPPGSAFFFTPFPYSAVTSPYTLSIGSLRLFHACSISICVYITLFPHLPYFQRPLDLHPLRTG